MILSAAFSGDDNVTDLPAALFQDDGALVHAMRG